MHNPRNSIYDIDALSVDGNSKAVNAYTIRFKLEHYREHGTNFVPVTGRIHVKVFVLKLKLLLDFGQRSQNLVWYYLWFPLQEELFDTGTIGRKAVLSS